MKTKVIIIGSLLVTAMAFEVGAQRAENDDMYFNSKDREKLKSEKVVATVKADGSVNDKIDSDYNAFRKKHFDKNEPETESVAKTENPTDSYSARSVNPEYIARANSEQASEDENYYVDGYVPPNVYDSYSASSYDNSYNNNCYYGNYGYGAYNSYNSMYSPYYGSCNPWMSPYSASPGWTMSMAYMWGSPWNSGWNYGMSYGWGNSYYNPYSFYPSYYSPYYYGNGYGYPNYYYGNVDSSRPNYGKRPSRHSAIVSPTPRSSERVSSNTTTSGNAGGRTRQLVDEYYVKPYKRTTSSDSFINSSTESSRGSYSRPASSDGSRTRDSYSSPSRDSRSSYSTPTRTSPQISMPSRSSGSSSGGSSGGSSPAPRKRN